MVSRDNRLTFVEVFLTLIVGWVLISLWEQVIKNFSYNTLGLDKNSTLHSLVIASAFTIVFMVFTFSQTDITVAIKRNLVQDGDLL